VLVTKNRFFNRSGFTLIEIMIVIAILAAVTAIGVPRMFGGATRMRSAIRKMAIMTREVRNVARLTQSTGRIVINMEAEKPHTYWVESAPGNAPMLSEEQEEELERMTRSQREDEAPKSQFKPETSVVKTPIELPRGLYFEGVELGSRKEEITEGKAYIHFFPQGLSEEAAIHISDRKSLNWTITVHPLTGRADVYERKIMLKDLRE
jgi:general secretion pathway protein H